MFSEPTSAMLFNSDNYPIAVRVLADLGFAARTRDGKSTVPNLMALFNLIFPKNEETYTYDVSILVLFKFLNSFSDYSDVFGGFSKLLSKWFCKNRHQRVPEFSLAAQVVLC